MRRGGLETMIMNYYRHIDRSKVQFDFLVHRNYESDYDQEILKMGGYIFHFPRLIPWNKLYQKKLEVFFKNHPEYKIVHVHQDCLSSIVLKCAKKAGIPVRIAHSHNSNQDKNWKYIIKLYYMRLIPKFATNLFACGRAAGDWMFCGHPYELIRNAIDCGKYCFSSEISKYMKNKLNMKDSIVIGHVGRFNAQKNHLFLLKVFLECKKLDPDIKLLLIGDGEDLNKIKKEVEKMGIKKDVLFTGTRSDVNDLMQAMDVFVFPSQYEGLPLTMIEAQASGLPCVISNRVPDECIVTDKLVTYCRLEDTPEKWASIIMEKAKLSRLNRTKEIERAGYDINTEATKLETFYLKKYKEVS